MKTSKTALAAAAFGVVAMVAPVNSGEVKYNFSSEFDNQAVAADERTEGGRFFAATNPQGGAETGQSIFGISLEFINSRAFQEALQTHYRQISAREAAERAERERIAAAKERREQWNEIRERLDYDRHETWSRRPR